MARAVVIVNPLSGRGRYEAEIRAHADARRRRAAPRSASTPRVRPTTARRRCARFAREAADAGVDLVVAWGGDGTVNEAACALVHTRRAARRSSPRDRATAWPRTSACRSIPARALHVAATGRDFAIDAGQVHDSLFFNIAGIGVDAVIAARFAERGLRRRGPLGYLQLGVAELLRYQAQTYTLSIDDERSSTARC